MTAPAPTPAHTAADTSHRARVQARIRDLQLKSLDIAERILDGLRAEQPEPPALPLTIARRQMANLLGMPALCHRARCRRLKACDGEPTHCLNTCIPALPEGVLTRILSVKAMRKRMRRR